MSNEKEPKDKKKEMKRADTKRSGFFKGVLDNLRSSVTQLPSGGKGPGSAGDVQDIPEDKLRKELFNIEKTSRYGFPYNPTAVAYDPIQKLVAVGTHTGNIRILGRPGVEVTIRHVLDSPVVQLQFIVNEGLLLSLCADDQIHQWNVKGKMAEIVHSLKFQKERVTFIHVPFQSKWLYLGTDGGNVHVVNVETFALSGYVINWNKAIEISRKTKPGAVVHLSENPVDSNKLLIGFETGTIVLWDLRSRAAEVRFQYNEALSSVSWHFEGKQFMASHGDGSLTTFNIRQPGKPQSILYPHARTKGSSISAAAAAGGFGQGAGGLDPAAAAAAAASGAPAAAAGGGGGVGGAAASSSGGGSGSGQSLAAGSPLGVQSPSLSSSSSSRNNLLPITKVQWRTTRAGDNYVIFSGGLPFEKGNSAVTTLTVSQGRSTTVLEMESPIVDFLTLNESPFAFDTQDPFAVVALLRSDLVVVDLMTQGYPCFRNPYSMDIHESPVVCCQYLADCPGDLIPCLYSVGAKAAGQSRHFSEREWPITGGEWGQGVVSYPELIVTGHADGSVRFWDASSLGFQLLYRLKTARLFEKLKSDDDPFAIEKMSFDPDGRQLAVAGSSYVALFLFAKVEGSCTVSVLDTPIHFEMEEPAPLEVPPPRGQAGATGAGAGGGGGYSAGSAMPAADGVVTLRPSPQKWSAGLQPSLVCQFLSSTAGGGTAATIAAAAAAIAASGGGGPPGAGGGGPAGPVPGPDSARRVTCLAVSSAYGLLAFGNDCGLVVVDTVRNTCILNFATPELYGFSSRCRTSFTPISSYTVSSSDRRLPSSDLARPVSHQPQHHHSPSSTTTSTTPTFTVAVTKSMTMTTMQTTLAANDSRSSTSLPGTPADTPMTSSNTARGDGSVTPVSGRQETTGPANRPTAVDLGESRHVKGKGPRPSTAGRESVDGNAGQQKQRQQQKQQQPQQQQQQEQPPPPRRSATSSPIGSTTGLIMAEQTANRPSSSSSTMGPSDVEAHSSSNHNNNNNNSNNNNDDPAVVAAEHDDTSKMSTSSKNKSSDDEPGKGRRPDPLRRGFSLQETIADVYKRTIQRVLSSPVPRSADPYQRSPRSPKRQDNGLPDPAESSPDQRAVSVPRQTREHQREATMAEAPRGPRSSGSPRPRCCCLHLVWRCLQSVCGCGLEHPGQGNISLSTLQEQHHHADSGSPPNDSSFKRLLQDCSFSRSRSSSISSLENVSHEAITCLTFCDTFCCSKKGDSSSAMPSLWVGTSLGSVLPLPLTLANESRSAHAFPGSGTLFKLKSPVLCIGFIDNTGAQLISDGGRLRSLTGSASSHFAVLVSEKLARVVSLPSQNTIVKTNLTDTSFVICADVMQLKSCDVPCLVSYIANGNILVHSLPSLKPVFEGDFQTLVDLRISRTFCFSRNGHGLYMSSPTEFQKFTVSAEFCNQLQELQCTIYTTKEMPEAPKQSFFKGLFGGGPSILDREELFGEASSGKASKTVARHIPGNAANLEAMKERSGTLAGEMARTRMALDERGQALSQLEERTGRMMTEAEMFASTTNQLMNKYKDKKWYQF